MQRSVIVLSSTQLEVLFHAAAVDVPDDCERTAAPAASGQLANESARTAHAGMHPLLPCSLCYYVVRIPL